MGLAERCYDVNIRVERMEQCVVKKESNMAVQWHGVRLRRLVYMEVSSC